MSFLNCRALRGWGCAAALAAASFAAMAQPLPDWRVSVPGNIGNAVALDRSNNVYVTGTATPAAISLGKHGAGGALAWQRSYSVAGYTSRSSSVLADAAGNAIVTGMLINSSGMPVSSVVLKYDPAGNLLWQDITSAAYAAAWRAVADAAGNLFVLGSTALPGTTLVTDVTLTRYSAAGVRQWTRSIGARYTAEAPLVITPAGLAVVSGGGAVANQSLLAAYDAIGNLVWSKPVAASTPLNLAVGRAGELAAVGSTTGGFFVMRHDVAFNELWRNIYPARGGATRAAFDGAGNLVVTGPVDTNTGLAQVLLYDWLTMKIDAIGNPLWARSYGAVGFVGDVPHALTIGADDAAYVTGQGNLPTTDSLGNVYQVPGTATVKYLANGTQAWVASTTTSSRGIGIQAGSDGGVVVLADSPQTLLRYPQSGAANLAPTALASASPSAGPAPLAVQFSATGSADADGTIAGYAWDFGDGQTSSLANPAHTYAAGSYTARLTVTDSLGAASAPATVVISANAVVLPPAKPTSLTLAASRIYEGSATTATVKVSSKAGATLTLTSSDPAVAGVPATVVVPAGATSASFTITTSAVRRNTGVTIRASANGASAAAFLTVVNR